MCLPDAQTTSTVSSGCEGGAGLFSLSEIAELNLFGGVNEATDKLVGWKGAT